MFKSYFPFILKLFSVYFFHLLFMVPQILLGQCNPINPLGTGIVTSGINDLGQSFTTIGSCGNGTITDITVYSVSSNTEVKLTIYSGSGCGSIIHEQTNVSIGESGMPVPTTIDVSPDVTFTAGATYTFRLELTGGGNFNLLVTDGMLDVYSGGDYYQDCSLQANQDLFFIVSTTSTPLPVELTKFEASNQNQQALLTWSTASEQNNLGFEVERSADGQQWEVLGFVPGNGTTTKTFDYQYIDAWPMYGTNYYRLRQLDFDGDMDYSPIKTVNHGRSAVDVVVFPNPVRAGSVLTVDGLGGAADVVILADIYGRPVWEGNAFGNESLKFNLPFDLPKGIYSVVVFSKGNRIATRVTVQ